MTPPDPIFADLLDSNGNIIRSVPLYYDPATGTSVGYGYGTFFGVGESQVPAGYTLGSIEFVKDDEGGYWKIINIYNGGDDKETEIVKVWEGLPDGVTPPDPIYVDILDGNGTVIATIPLYYDPATGTSRGYYTGTFAAVGESQVPAGYTLDSISYVDNGDGTGYWKVVNKYKKTEIVKEWVGLPDGVTPPDEVTFDVLGDDGNVIGTVTLIYDPATGRSTGYFNGTVGGIRENPVPDGYESGDPEFVEDDNGGYW